jgi:pre-60S factor REI1
MVGVGGLTSTTAPGKVFDSRLDLANHYKSDWHKYNLKRREAGMAMLEEEDFNARLEAALALRKEREGRAARTGTDHLKNKKNRKEIKHKKKNKKKNNSNSNSNEQQQHEQEANTSDTAIPTTTSATEIGNSTASTSPDDVERSQNDESNIANSSSADVNMEEEEEEEEEAPTIDPRQCLFDNHMSASVEKNVDRMYQKYGFFIPDREYLVDLEGLIGYCAEKVKLGHMCLYCQKTFSTWRGCQEHMIDTQHTKLLYERGKDQEEFDVFYDFTEADAEFLGTTKEEARIKHMRANQMIVEEDQADDDSGEWEDLDDDDDELMGDADDDDDDDGVYGAYKDEIAKHGFDITPMGELVFPDGRIIGHRGLSRYYKQRFTSDGSNRTAVRAARRAAGERLYKGQVYETYQPTAAAGDRSSSALTLAKANISRAGIGGGRMSRGILVPSAGAGAGNSFTALSLYRYKAAVKKSRREEHRGMRLQQRTSLPMNKMDKKANRLMNGVSVAHAAR